MALTGSLAISAATGRSGADAVVTLTLTNTGSTAVNLLSVQPTKSSVAAPNHNQVPVSLGMAPVLPGQNNTIGSLSSLTKSWTIVGGGFGIDDHTYYLGCVVRYTDGSTTTELRPTPVTYQVTSDANHP